MRRSNTCDDSRAIPTWLLTRINDYEQIVIAAVDPQFSIVANSVLPNDLSTDRFLANVAKIDRAGTTLQRPPLRITDRSQPPGARHRWPAHAESLVPLLANMLGALAGAEAALAASTRRAERSALPSMP